MELLDQIPTPDIDTILALVEAGGQAGLRPENILDDHELMVYQEFIENDLPERPTEHYDNLVPAIEDRILKKIGQDVVNWVRFDEDTRRDWIEREAKGIRMMGVSDRDIGKAPFEGSSMVVHPLLAEAVTEFHARAIAEMWPAEGPVKTQVLGSQDPDRIQQSQRVQDYMNYQYTEDMPGAFEEEDALLFRLPLSGSCFKKVYYDPISCKICSRLIEPADFIVPFSATDLETAPRYTHRFREMHNTLLKKIAKGYYTKPRVLSEAVNEMADYPVIKDEIDHTEGRASNGIDEKMRHTIYEMVVYLDIEGYEDIGEDGLPTGIELPYIVTVDRDTMDVLRIQRNWKETDQEHKQSECCVAHYRFMPGFGFYGYGLLHLIGGLAAAATGSLRALLDAAAFANLQGGFRTRDSRVNKNGDQPIAPGEWREVDSSYEELNKTFFRLPYEEPSPTLFKLLGYLDERGQKFVGTTEVMDGSANANAPVGTTLALIEQGAKKFSAIHKRLHNAHKSEFRILARLNSLYVPEQGYPYFTSKGERTIFASDFDDRVDVIPVSDPEIISSTQRIVQAQAVLDLTDKHPDKMDVVAALRAMLVAMRVSNVDELLQPDTAMQEANMKSLQLDIDIKKATLEKLQAERTESALRGLFSAIQAAQLVVSMPGIAPISDSIYLSAGGVDANGLPIADTSSLQGLTTNNAANADIPQNTSPGFPAIASPEQPSVSQPALSAPQSPEVGALSGIETQRNEIPA
jgi:hypothetical protein